MPKTALAPELQSVARRTPEIDPARVQVQGRGQVRSEYFIRLPEGFVADDLKEPAAWRKVMGAGRNFGIKKFDTVFLVSFDEDWTAEALVADASNSGVVLAKPRVTAMPVRYTALFQDDKYRVAWNGHGYIVERKADGHVMTAPTANAELATRLLAQLYPARV